MTSLLQWGAAGSKTFETGLDRGVLFVREEDGTYPVGVVWNGLVSVNENPSGGEITKKYADNQVYLQQISREEFVATIEAFMYPAEFAQCDGSLEAAPGVFMGQQDRSSFGLAYRTLVGNDVVGESYGYQLHLVYGAMAKPSQRGHSTVNESPEAIQFSWEIQTTPVVNVTGKPTAHIVIDSNSVDSAKLEVLETLLYGDASVPETPPMLPSPDVVISTLS